ncbi:MAG: UDP-N-acetylmuramoyl-tripeptide--D-alanyl-D-alanine ligase [Planctomycetota bacterium]
MESLSLGQVAAAVSGQLSQPNSAQKAVARVCTDSRQVRPGDLFLCLRGPHHDAHEHAAGALAAGAVALVVSRPLPETAPQIVVSDTGAALGALGRAVRRGLGRPASAPALHVVGITGTNGKTSTKDLTRAALSARYATVASRSSFNNEVGVPLTLLEIGAGTQAAVVELGTNAPGEIAALAAQAEPTVGVITNIQPGHLQGLGSLSGVLAEKSALLAALVGPRCAVLNRDDPAFAELARRAPGPVLSFGFDPAAHVRAEDLRCSPEGTRFRLRGHEVRLQLLGRHAASNALAALACAELLEVPLGSAIAALAEVAPAPGRLVLRQCGDLTLIDDSYTANPGSLLASCAAVSALGLPGRFVAVVGEMLELGADSAALHRRVGEQLGAQRPGLLLVVGEAAQPLLAGALAAGLPASAALSAPDLAAAGALLDRVLAPGDVVLLKASRRAQLDQLVTRLAARAVAVPA